MKIEVKVTPSAKKQSVKQEGGVWKVALTTAPEGGKANKALIALLAKHFKVKKSQIEIIKGLKSRRKTISIEYI